ncbi:rap guanine nucleotide exchange factor 4-like [Physella acuta]|uniref:rap guanine nucleotide exchange factor 4-like n=1 Tax=Physella acuta TaxID=109671 RepID=UPI0027DC8E33|nr:rap guanine nucleotide exchange factor 4-like [Physella acuta]XP_059140454.1 rap guanine nucleotide exchange factor 4-like [Physella acuta]XP_059140455.1 rap guanine nucleotide exchange factor 4-like [Physella acuta]XP_059140456.1 rap guanine nucleotide exchange factor 4-like [Physella acuta]XP_059140457.1 rap guanine nucleotide exchange factor 4-like [Physella acuta]XP_059140458.1 rap guanine nucleotide exchange factor 4-like [Physella acuta]
MSEEMHKHEKNISSMPTGRNESRPKLKTAVSKWYSGLLKRPIDRSAEDVNRAFAHLKDLNVMEKFNSTLLQQMCCYAHYDKIEENVIVIRQGEHGTNWYFVLSGTLSVFLMENSKLKSSQPLCTLLPASSFGEGILTQDPHQMTVVTSSVTELLWFDLKDVKVLWERNKELMESAFTALANLPNLSDDMRRIQTGKDLDLQEIVPNPAAPISLEPSSKMSHASWVLRTVLMIKYPHMIRDRKYHLRTYKRCMVGSEMVDWIMSIFPRVDCRELAVGMFQALLEDGALLHVCKQHPFLDKYLFYRFLEDEEGSAYVPNELDLDRAEDDLFDVLSFLAQVSPDASMRMILRKMPEERTQDEIGIIYEELLQIKPLQHLSYTVKRELASCIMFEAHSKAGAVLFNQGDEGRSWYIILKGSVNVSIYGKGVVCVLGEADDFGKLALMNDAPRAATIALAEDNCHFLRVDKDDFNRILRDVEANTVRLKEHGQDVLVLEKIPVAVNMNGSFHSEYKYSVMAGTPEKVLEYLLETRSEQKKDPQVIDMFLDDFLLTHSIFFPDDKLCSALLSYYHSDSKRKDNQDDGDFVQSQKKCVLQFVLAWHDTEPDKFHGSTFVGDFLETLTRSVYQDCVAHSSLIPDHEALLAITNIRKNSVSGKPAKKKSLFMSRKGQAKSALNENDVEKKSVIKPTDEYIFKVYCADHTYTTIRLPINSTVKDIVLSARDKLCLGHDPVLCEVKSNGERIVFKEKDRCIMMSLSLNGRLFIAPREHLDALTPVPEQEGPTSSTAVMLELMSTKELAYQITLYDWELFTAVHEQEMLTKVFGLTVFPEGISANLEQLLKRFEQLQYWVVTEMVLVTNLGKRVQILRKFIKLAQHCKEMNNFHAFFAITMGLGHLAVSRLSQTWEKLPGKAKKMFSEFETFMEPARNHRCYRLAVSKLSSPIIPFMPLLIKDMTFTNEGNKTYYDNMVNFEKMHMIAQTLRTVKFCRQNQIEPEPPESMKASADIKSYIRNLHVIDNQRILTNLSHKCEPRKG